MGLCGIQHVAMHFAKKTPIALSMGNVTKDAVIEVVQVHFAWQAWYFVALRHEFWIFIALSKKRYVLLPLAKLLASFFVFPCYFSCFSSFSCLFWFLGRLGGSSCPRVLSFWLKSASLIFLFLRAPWTRPTAVKFTIMWQGLSCT